MKYASEDLRNEHEGVLFGLEILEQISNTAMKSNSADIRDINDMINFLRLFADKCPPRKRRESFVSCHGKGRHTKRRRTYWTNAC